MASLDYYNGQIVTEVVAGDEDWQWAIILSGGAVIKNWDQRRTAKPEGLEGLGLLMTAYGETDTTLTFGIVEIVSPVESVITHSVEVVLTPTQYSLTDPVHATTEEFPQRQTEMVVENAEALYPDHLLAREQAGPENQEDEIATEEDAASDGASTADKANA